MTAMVNMNNLLNGKDSRWLQLEVCREFQRNKCSRPDTECKFAHPPANVEVQNGRVTACYDSIKGRCNREKPPCKYFHPPQHLKDQLLINGRNHLALKNAIMQQMGIAPGQPVVPGQVVAATNPYLTGIPASSYPYFPHGHLVPTILGPDPSTVASPLGPVVQQAVPVAQQKIPRSDRLESAPVSTAVPVLTAAASNLTPLSQSHQAVASQHQSAGAVALGHHPMEAGKKRAADNDMFQLMDMKSVGSFYYDNFAFAGMLPYKRPAADKSGMPVYQPGATTYQQLMQLQQPFVPVSCEYPSPSPSTAVAATTIPQTSTTNNANAIINNSLLNNNNLIAVNNNNNSINNNINSNCNLYSKVNNNSNSNIVVTTAAASIIQTSSQMSLLNNNNNRSNLVTTSSSTFSTSTTATTTTTTTPIISTPSTLLSTSNANSITAIINNSNISNQIIQSSSTSITTQTSLPTSVQSTAASLNTNTATTSTSVLSSPLPTISSSTSSLLSSIKTDILTANKPAVPAYLTAPSTSISHVSLAATAKPSISSAQNSYAMAIPSASSASTSTAPAISLHNHHALINAHLYSQTQQHVEANVLPSQTITLPIATSNLYPQQAHLAQAQSHASHAAQTHYDPAALAKEVAQKNYATALKMAATSNALAGKPLTALTYTGVPFNKNVAATAALLSQQQQHHNHSNLVAAQHAQAAQAAQHAQAAQAAQAAHAAQAAAAAAHQHTPAAVAQANHAAAIRLQQQAAYAAAQQHHQQQFLPQAAAYTRPPPVLAQPTASPQLMRPDALTAMQQYAWANAIAANQYQNQLFYSRFAAGGYPQQLTPGAASLTPVSSASFVHPGTNYALQLPQAPIQSTPQTVGTVPTQAGSTVGLNPYKKMKVER